MRREGVTNYDEEKKFVEVQIEGANSDYVYFEPQQSKNLVRTSVLLVRKRIR